MDSALRPAGQPPVPLSALVSGLGLTGDTGSRALVTGITLDSRAVEHGWLYVALPGTRAHGAEFAGSAVAAVSMLKKRGFETIVFVCIVSCPEGVARLEQAHPDVAIYTASIDDGLNASKYILPGLGDAGDRLFGTK